MGTGRAGKRKRSADDDGESNRNTKRRIQDAGNTQLLEIRKLEIESEERVRMKEIELQMMESNERRLMMESNERRLMMKERRLMMKERRRRKKYKERRRIMELQTNFKGKQMELQHQYSLGALGSGENLEMGSALRSKLLCKGSSAREMSSHKSIKIPETFVNLQQPESEFEVARKVDATLSNGVKRQPDTDALAQGSSDVTDVSQLLHKIPGTTAVDPSTQISGTLALPSSNHSHKSNEPELEVGGLAERTTETRDDTGSKGNVSLKIKLRKTKRPKQQFVEESNVWPIASSVDKKYSELWSREVFDKDDDRYSLYGYNNNGAGRLVGYPTLSQLVCVGAMECESCQSAVRPLTKKKKPHHDLEEQLHIFLEKFDELLGGKGAHRNVKVAVHPGTTAMSILESLARNGVICEKCFFTDGYIREMRYVKCDVKLWGCKPQENGEGQLQMWLCDKKTVHSHRPLRGMSCTPKGKMAIQDFVDPTIPSELEMAVSSSRWQITALMAESFGFESGNSKPGAVRRHRSLLVKQSAAKVNTPDRALRQLGTVVEKWNFASVMNVIDPIGTEDNLYTPENIVGEIVLDVEVTESHNGDGDEVDKSQERKTRKSKNKKRNAGSSNIQFLALGCGVTGDAIMQVSHPIPSKYPLWSDGTEGGFPGYRNEAGQLAVDDEDYEMPSNYFCNQRYARKAFGCDTTFNVAQDKDLKATLVIAGDSLTNTKFPVLTVFHRNEDYTTFARIFWILFVRLKFGAPGPETAARFPGISVDQASAQRLGLERVFFMLGKRCIIIPSLPLRTVYGNVRTCVFHGKQNLNDLIKQLGRRETGDKESETFTANDRNNLKKVLTGSAGDSDEGGYSSWHIVQKKVSQLNLEDMTVLRLDSLAFRLVEPAVPEKSNPRGRFWQVIKTTDRSKDLLLNQVGVLQGHAEQNVDNVRQAIFGEDGERLKAVMLNLWQPCFGDTCQRWSGVENFLRNDPIQDQLWNRVQQSFEKFGPASVTLESVSFLFRNVLFLCFSDAKLQNFWVDICKVKFSSTFQENVYNALLKWARDLFRERAVLMLFTNMGQASITSQTTSANESMNRKKKNFDLYFSQISKQLTNMFSLVFLGGLSMIFSIRHNGGQYVAGSMRSGSGGGVKTGGRPSAREKRELKKIENEIAKTSQEKGENEKEHSLADVELHKTPHGIAAGIPARFIAKGKPHELQRMHYDDLDAAGKDQVDFLQSYAENLRAAVTSRQYLNTQGTKGNIGDSVVAVWEGHRSLKDSGNDVSGSNLTDDISETKNDELEDFNPLKTTAKQMPKVKSSSIALADFYVAIDASSNDSSIFSYDTSKFEYEIQLIPKVLESNKTIFGESPDIWQAWKRNTWLRSSSIDDFARVVNEEHDKTSHVMPTSALQKLGQGPAECFKDLKGEVHKYKFLFAPMHIGGNHWALLCLSLHDRVAFIIDSLKRDDKEEEDESNSHADQIIRGLREFADSMQQEKKMSSEEKTFWAKLASEWCVKRVEGNPKQPNTTDCGVFVLATILCIRKGEKFMKFTTDNMNGLRNQILAKVLRRTFEKQKSTQSLKIGKRKLKVKPEAKFAPHGIPNPGNCCHLISVLITLYHCNSFRKALAEAREEGQIKGKEDIVTAVEKVFEAMEIGPTEANNAISRNGQEQGKTPLELLVKYLGFETNEVKDVEESLNALLPRLPVANLFEVSSRTTQTCESCSFELFSLLVERINFLTWTFNRAFRHHVKDSTEMLEGQHDCKKGSRLCTEHVYFTTGSIFAIQYGLLGLRTIELQIHLPESLGNAETQSQTSESNFHLRSLIVFMPKRNHYVTFIRVQDCWQFYSDGIVPLSVPYDVMKHHLSGEINQQSTRKNQAQPLLSSALCLLQRHTHFAFYEKCSGVAM